MNTETDGQQAGTGGEAAAEAPVVEAASAETSEDTAEQTTGAEEPGQADEAGEAPRKKPWWEKRFDELTAQKYDAQRQAEYWRGRFEAGHQQPQAAPTGSPPQEEQFGTYEEYEQARIDYAVERRLETAREIERREASQRSFGERVERVRDKLPDFDLYVGDPTLPITPLMAEVIRESDVGPEVAYHLGKNRQECQRIAALPQHRQAAELGRIEAKLSIQQTPTPPAPRPAPPAPPQTVAGLSAGTGKSPDEMSMAEYMDWVKTRDKP